MAQTEMHSRPYEPCFETLKPKPEPKNEKYYMYDSSKRMWWARHGDAYRHTADLKEAHLFTLKEAIIFSWRKEDSLFRRALVKDLPAQDLDRILNRPQLNNNTMQELFWKVTEGSVEAPQIA